MLTCDIGHETSSVNEAHNHSTTHSSAINFRDYRQSKEDNPEKLATYGTQDEKKKKKKKRNPTKTQHNICVGHHYTQTNTNNVNKTCVLLQRTGGKDEPNIVIMRKS